MTDGAVVMPAKEGTRPHAPAQAVPRGYSAPLLEPSYVADTQKFKWVPNTAAGRRRVLFLFLAALRDGFRSRAVL